MVCIISDWFRTCTQTKRLAVFQTVGGGGRTRPNEASYYQGEDRQLYMNVS